MTSVDLCHRCLTSEERLCWHLTPPLPPETHHDNHSSCWLIIKYLLIPHISTHTWYREGGVVSEWMVCQRSQLSELLASSCVPLPLSPAALPALSGHASWHTHPPHLHSTLTPHLPSCGRGWHGVVREGLIHLLELEGLFIEMESGSVAVWEREEGAYRSPGREGGGGAYLTLTWRDTYLAPKHSTIARDAYTQWRVWRGLLCDTYMQSIYMDGYLVH